MRMIYALPLMMLAGACQVTEDDANDSVTIEYDQNTAEQAASDVATTAENIAGDIGNDIQDTSATLENRAENTDVDVDVDTNTQDNR